MRILTIKLLLIFSVSCLTHLPGLFNPLLDFHGWAQTLRASISRNFYEGGMNFFKPQIDFQGNDLRHASTQFPLYSYLVAVCYKFFGVNEVWGRVLSMIFAAGSAVLLYFLICFFGQERVALISSLVFSFIPIRIYFMRTFMPESMAIFFLLAGYLFTALYLNPNIALLENGWRQKSQLEKEKFFPYGFCSAIFLALSFLLKLPYIFLSAPALFLISEKYGRKAFYKKELYLWSGLIIIFLGSWYGYTIFGLPALTGEESFFKNELDYLKEWRSLKFWTTHFLSRTPELLTTYAGLLFLVVGLKEAWQKKIRFILAWFLSAVSYLILCGKYGKVHQYAALPLSPIYAVLIALGILSLWAKVQEKSSFKMNGVSGLRACHSFNSTKVLFILLVLSMPLHAFLRIRHWYDLTDFWVLRAKVVAKDLSKREDLFYIYAEDQPFYLYHLARKGFTHSRHPYGSGRFKEALKQGIKFFLVPGELKMEEKDPLFLEQFNLVYRDLDFSIYERI